MPVDETPTAEPIAPSTEAEQNHTLTPAGVPQPLRVRAGRYGEMDSHELVQLLDSIDSEVQRARFRESLYISVFVWIVVAWFALYGPRLLWHAPKLISPTDVLRDRELTRLTAPSMPHVAAPASKPTPKPAIDNKTMEHLRETARRTPPPTPLPEAPKPTPAVATQPPPPPVATPQPRTPPPVVADAPTVQPTQQPTRPNFGSTPSASNAMRDALNGATRNRDTGGGLGRVSGRNTPLNMGGVEVLSDTQGVDFNPYLRRIYSDIYRNWLPLIPQETLPPLSKEGQAFIRFTILPDGSIGEMHLDGSTHDEAINRSCWGSITTEGQFPPLPSQFHGPQLELRIHYIVSQRPVE